MLFTGRRAPALIALLAAFASSVAMITVSSGHAKVDTAMRAQRISLLDSVAPDSGGGEGCNPERTNNYPYYYWVGAQSENGDGTPGGVYASISNYSPFVAGPNQGAPSDDATSEWVMLDNTSSQYDYEQIGWVEFAGSVRNTFVQYSEGPGTAKTYYYAPYPINSMQSYSALYQPGNSSPFVLAVNGKYLTETALSWVPNNAQINAELHTQASQIPGGTADSGSQVAQVTGAHVWPNAGSGGWENFDGATGGSSGSSTAQPSWMGIAPLGLGINNWRTWDKACTK